jgi:sporulation protein YlmC with PRC-barrel domain
MAELLQLVAGSEVRCTDGRVGHVRGLIFDPESSAITHLSIDASSPLQNGRIIPVSSVESGGSVVELGCARDDYYAFPENEALDFVAGPRPTTVHVHLVPHGESEIKGDENVHATDGRAGHLVGAVVDRDGHTIQELVVQVGHFSGRRQVAIPFDAVTSVDEHGINVRLSKDEVSKLEPL